MRNPRGLLPAALTLVGLSFVVLATEPAPTRPVVAVAAPSTTTTTTPPTTTTRAAIVTTTTAKPAPVTTAAAPRVTTPRPPAPATTAPPVKPSGKAESCGWQWDAIRVDDGSSNEVTMTLDAARRPNESVTIFADFAGPDSPTAARTTTTDGAGEATVKFNVSEDKRDWTITISASFAAGGTCAPQTFTLDY
jgi:hypothetical protein